MIDLFISEKEVNIDVESLDEMEEDSFFSSLLKPIKLESKKNDVLFVVVKTYKDDLVKDFPNFCLCGKSLVDYLLLAGRGCETVVIEDGDVLEKLKEIKTDKKIISVFYCDTPLVDEKTFLRILDYFVSKNLDYLKLSRGFIIKKDCLDGDFILRSAPEYEDKNLFAIEDAIGLNYANKVLQERIRLSHLNNGVIILGEQSVFIDYDTVIEKGVVIYPNNILKGKTIIQKNVTLLEGNLISESVILEECTLENCFVKNSKIDGNHSNEKIEGQGK